MSRIILLLIMAAWMVGVEELKGTTRPPQGSITFYFSGYLAAVMSVAIWARLIAQRSTAANFRDLFRHFSTALLTVRWLIPAWMVVDIVRGGAWTHWVRMRFDSNFDVPALVIGTAPALLTWIALWWAEYPADRALREQNVLDEVINGMPVHEPPTLLRLMITLLRQQFLPILIPILMITVFRDLVTLVRFSDNASELMMIPAALAVYLLSPFLLIWLFNARPLDDSPLRQRLEAICQRCGLRYRNIMLWQTDFSMANAAVIGLLPGWRYVLLSDRLLETMTDREIEAVFAHELGHIVHNHMAWFVVFFAILVLASLGPGQLLEQWLKDHHYLPNWLAKNYAIGLVWGGLLIAATIIFLGYLSRRLERQADVFAARMMEVNWGWPTAQPSEAPRIGVEQSYVGQKGSALFAAALNRVAFVNNIPLRARGFFHPSIARRLLYLEEMSMDPVKTTRFDEVMRRLYVFLIAVLLTFALATAKAMWPVAPKSGAGDAKAYFSPATGTDVRMGSEVD